MCDACMEIREFTPVPPPFLEHPDAKAEAAAGYREVVAYIEANGWYQGDWFEDGNNVSTSFDPFPSNCKVCTMGGMAVVSGSSLAEAFNTSKYYNMERYAIYRLKELTGARDGMLAEWNDDESTTVEDVLNFLSTLADELEQ